MLKNDQIYPEIGISDHCWLIWCPVDGLAGGCGARAVSQKTPIYFILYSAWLKEHKENSRKSNGTNELKLLYATADFKDCELQRRHLSKSLTCKLLPSY